MLKLLKKVLLPMLEKMSPRVQGGLRVALYNFLMIASFRFPYNYFRIHSVNSKRKAWLFTRGKESIYLAIPNRVGFYKEGVRKRIDSLQSTFGVEKFNIKASDYVIDIGSNIGEFSIPLLEKGVKVGLFEMDPNVIDALKLNIESYDNAAIYNLGLWKEAKVINMFVKSDSADTSLIDNGAVVKHEVQCYKLDDIEEIHDIEFIKLLKCDAEGAEPEVLQGAKNVLKKTNYVSIDCGPERGRKNERTLDEVKKILIDLGFRVLQEEYGSREILIAENMRYS